jgi:septal ring factor EnvC (AmiA/AmiB activator)
MLYNKILQLDVLFDEFKEKLSEENPNIDNIEEIKNNLKKLINDIEDDLNFDIDDLESDINDLKKEIRDLNDQIFYKKEELKNNNLNIFKIDNMYDLQKLEILNTLFETKNLNQLEEIIIWKSTEKNM